MTEDEKFVEEMKASLVNKDPLENKVLFRDEFDQLLTIIDRQKLAMEKCKEWLAKAQDDVKGSGYIEFAEQMRVKAVRLEQKLTIATESLEKISKYETAGDGMKYPSYESGWRGVADFAEAALTKIKGGG